MLSDALSEARISIDFYLDNYPEIYPLDAPLTKRIIRLAREVKAVRASWIRCRAAEVLLAKRGKQ